MKRIAYYGGSFDPLHNGHLQIARQLTELFLLDEFVFIPAFHAPHKKNKNPTSAFHRYAMLCLATSDDKQIKVSRMELEAPQKPYTVETLTRLKNESNNATQIFFVMGADSWNEITTWREWETVLTIVNIIVVTRPGYPIESSHVTEEIRQRIVDLRNENQLRITNYELRETENQRIFITDAVNLDVSASEIRQKIRGAETDWREKVSVAVANYIEKYEIYK